MTMQVVTSVKSIALTVLFSVCLFASPCFGQRFTKMPGELPPAPSVHVLDNADLYGRDPETLEAIIGRLVQLQVEHGFQVYIVIESMLLDSYPADLSARLQRAWLPDGNGLVIVFEVDNRAFGVPPPHSDGEEFSRGGVTTIPTYVMAPIFDKIGRDLEVKQQKGLMEPQVLLDELTKSLVRECEEYFNRQFESERDIASKRMLLGFLASLPLLALLSWLGARMLNRVDARNNRRLYFPDAPGVQRLDAPFGAQVSSRRFSG